MQIFVKNIQDRSLTLDVNANSSIDEVKQMIEDREFVSGFRLVSSGKQLNSGNLCDYGIADADTITMLLSVDGGMRAKWRKKRMRRLRRKRRKMRQRAR